MLPPSAAGEGRVCGCAHLPPSALRPPLARRSVGLLTKGLINRAQYYDHALTLSLVPFRHGDLYP